MNAVDKPVMLITGTSKGIGAYLVDFFLKKGYSVIGCSRGLIDCNDANYFHLSLDLSNETNILEIFTFIRKKFGRLDALINNAAINPAILPVALIPNESILKIFKINVFAPILICREAIKIMKRNKNGRIINIGSMATKHEVAGESMYTSTKSAINSFSRVLAKEVIDFGITVNVLAPSAIKTDLSDAINQNALKEVLSRNAIKDFGQFSDVANTIEFLIRDDSNAVTGQIIYLGGA